MLANAVVALALFASAVSAQYNASYIDPTTVPDGLKASWCNGQENVCLTLCSKSINNNTCDPTTLTYSCLCKSNNSAPDLADYVTSMPSFICEQSYALCINLTVNQNNQAGQDNCTTNIKDRCGTLEIANFTAPSTSSSASATASPTSAPSGAGGASGSASSSAASTSPTKNAAATALIVGKEYGSGIIAAVFVAAFGFMV